MNEKNIHIIIVKYLTKAASSEEENELLAWLSQTEDNRCLFRSMKDAFDLGQFERLVKSSNTAEEWKKLLRRIKQPAAKQTKQLHAISPFRKIMRYAAVFVFGLLCMKALDAVFTEKPVETEFITTLETGKGERSKLTLPDSTVVWLNACSYVSYGQDFGKQTRKVNLHGEAYFDVRKDASKPFLVCSDNFTYRVTGTSFNLYSFDNDNIESIVLVEGAVSVESGSFRAEIKPGELLEFDKTTRKIRRHRINTALYTGWRFGELMFDRMTFEELAKRLERNFNVTFVFENNRVKKESFGGTFRHYDSLETILKVIKTSTPFKYRIEKDTVYIK
jgi:ferric-dicitrate binding protein FerR (iron transport regulator)